MLYVNDPDSVLDAIKMGSAVAGCEEDLVKKPIFNFLAALGQPLTWDLNFIKGFVEAARHGLPVMVHSGVMAGATGPVTLAGTLALSNAEILSGITIIQMVNPGTPVIYTNYARIFDMKAGNVCLAGPEFALLRLAAGQLARQYHLPYTCAGFSTDSKTLDVQNGFEMYVALMSLMAGANVLLGGHLDEGAAIDPLSWIVDDEVAASYLRIMRGFEVDDLTLALDVIKEVGVGPGKNFMTNKHTHDHLRQEHWLDYSITERRTYRAWELDGAKDTKQKAKERLKEKLKSYKPDPLPLSVQTEIDNVVDQAKKRRK
jgi:trimethylamine--corrinoid protein Co-methyltransferase